MLMLAVAFCEAAFAETLIESWVSPEEFKAEKSTALSPAEYCDSVRKQTQRVMCSTVAFPGGNSYAVLDYSQRALPDEGARGNDALRCDLQFSSEYANLSAEYFNAFKESSTSGVKRKIAAANTKLQGFAFANRDKLLTYLEANNCKSNRAAAAGLVRFVPECVVQALSLSSYMHDGVLEVRNGVAQCIGVAILFQDQPTRRKIVDDAFRLLALPNHSDRNKALGLIHNAVEANEATLTYVREKHTSQLMRVARMSIIPNVGGTARQILTTLDVSLSGEVSR